MLSFSDDFQGPDFKARRLLQAINGLFQPTHKVLIARCNKHLAVPYTLLPQVDHWEMLYLHQLGATTDLVERRVQWVHGQIPTLQQERRSHHNPSQTSARSLEPRGMLWAFQLVSICYGFEDILAFESWLLCDLLVSQPASIRHCPLETSFLSPLLDTSDLSRKNSRPLLLWLALFCKHRPCFHNSQGMFLSPWTSKKLLLWSRWNWRLCVSSRFNFSRRQDTNLFLRSHFSLKDTCQLKNTFCLTGSYSISVPSGASPSHWQ